MDKIEMSSSADIFKSIISVSLLSYRKKIKDALNNQLYKFRNMLTCN